MTMTYKSKTTRKKLARSMMM